MAWPLPWGAHTPDVWDVQNMNGVMVGDAQGILGVQRQHLTCPRVREVFSKEAAPESGLKGWIGIHQAGRVF